MFDRLKKAFTRNKPDPEPIPGVFIAADDDRELAKMIDGMVAVQVALGGLDEDPGNWLRDERATVLGYIDGWASRWCLGLRKPERAELLSILAVELQFKGRRQMDVLSKELWHLPKVRKLCRRLRTGSGRGNRLACHTDADRYYFVQYYQDLSLPGITEKINREDCEQLRATVATLGAGLFSESTRPSVCVPRDQGKLMELLFAEQDARRAARDGK
jgi:hypothetical protein